MDTKYLIKIFKEFQKAYNITASNESFEKYKDLFIRWIISKKKAADEYALLFDEIIDSNKYNGQKIAEFNQGLYDTSVIEITRNTHKKPIIISPYASTIKPEYEIETYSGKLEVLNNDVYVTYSSAEETAKNPNCNQKFNDNIALLTTQLPCSSQEIYPFLNLIDSEKNLLIGAYGSVLDNDKEHNLTELEKIYNILNELSLNNRLIEFYKETSNGAYLSALKIENKKPKVKTR